MTFITAAGSALMTMLDRLSSVTAHTLLVEGVLIADERRSDEHADDVQSGGNDRDDRCRSAGNDQGLRTDGQTPWPDAIEQVWFAARAVQKTRSARRAGVLIERDDLPAARTGPTDRRSRGIGIRARFGPPRQSLGSRFKCRQWWGRGVHRRRTGGVAGLASPDRDRLRR
jgi:hypothetical protein